MLTKVKRVGVLLFIGSMMFAFVACGSNTIGDTQNSQMETESEKKVEIIDATDILSKVWEKYEVVDTDGNRYNNRFDIMGGHFESSVMNMPAQYDLNQTSDLTLMYCVPETAISMIDDAATMVDLYNAGQFTVGAYHISQAENVQSFIEGIQTQVSMNQWHGKKPEKLLIIELDGQYVVSVYGEEALVNEFKQKLIDIYSSMANIVEEQKLLDFNK